MSPPRKNLSPSEKMRAAGAEEPDDRSSGPLLRVVAGIIAAVLLFGGCLCGGIMWWFSPRLGQDPQRAEQLLRQIVQIDVPDSFQPHGTIQWNVPFFMKIRGVYFDRYPGDGQLALVEISSRNASEQEIRRILRETIHAHGSGGMELIVDGSQTTRKSFDIHGERVEFAFEVARDSPTNREFRLVEGIFDVPGGQLLLMLRVEESRWNEEEVAAMLHSIGKPVPPRNSIPESKTAMPATKSSERRGR